MLDTLDNTYSVVQISYHSTTISSDVERRSRYGTQCVEYIQNELNILHFS